MNNGDNYRFSRDPNFFSLPTPPKSLRDEGRTAKPKFTRRLVRCSAGGVGRFIEGGLARHPLGGLKYSTCPPEFTRHSCGGCGGFILCKSVSKKGSESLVFSFGAEGRIRVKPVSVSQYQKSPCQFVAIFLY
jgi:hypothetical protein